MALSSSRDSLTRILDAARSPQWSLGLDRDGAIMATFDTGEIGAPWIVKARARGRAMRVSFYAPGDDSDLEGEVIGALEGTPREMGRQLRGLLENLHFPDRSTT